MKAILKEGMRERKHPLVCVREGREEGERQGGKEGKKRGGGRERGVTKILTM